MKVFSIELKVPSAGRVVLTAVVLAILSSMVVASLGPGRVTWGAVGALAGGALCSMLGIDSTRGGKELVVSTLAAAVFALLAMALRATL